MARIYFGGPSAEIELVIADAEKLVAAGHSITEPWWDRIHEAKALGYAHDAEVPDDYMAESAERNEEGLLVADAIVFRMRTRPADRGRIGGPSGGLAYEFGWIKGYYAGCAFRGGDRPNPIYIIGEPLRFIGIWTEPKPIVVSSIEDVIARLPPPRY